MSKKTRLLQSIDQQRMRGGAYVQNTFWDPRWPKRQFLAVSGIYFFFWTLNSFTLLSTDQNRFNSVNRMSEDELEVKIHLYPNFWEDGVLRRQKCKNYSFFSQLIENQKMYNISKDQPSKIFKFHRRKFTYAYPPKVFQLKVYFVFMRKGEIFREIFKNFSILYLWWFVRRNFKYTNCWNQIIFTMKAIPHEIEQQNLY